MDEQEVGGRVTSKDTEYECAYCLLFKRYLYIYEFVDKMSQLTFPDEVYTITTGLDIF